MKMDVHVINSTRPCIATINFKMEYTDEELQKMYDEIPDYTLYKSKYGGTGYNGFVKNYRTYYQKREVKAQWHMFAQKTEEDDNGNIQYPVAVIELEDGTVKTVNAEDIKFIKEEDSNE